MQLPILATNMKSKLWCFVIGFAATMILYQTSNRVHFFEPRLLPLSTIDQWVPFLPWTVFIYFTEYVIFVAAFLSMKDDLTANKYFYSYLTILVFSTIVFILYPVTFPRELYSLDNHPEGISKWTLQYFRTYMDTPANCLPSLHVSSCFISGFSFWQENRKKFWFFTIWSVAVSISTLTTKQHYLIDISTALMLTGAVYWFFFYKAIYYYPARSFFAWDKPQSIGSDAGAIR